MDCHRQVVRDRQLKHDAVFPAVFRNVRDAPRDRLLRVARSDRSIRGPVLASFGRS
jgi:hypothetical protein